MKPRHQINPDRAFAKTMLGVTLAMLAILAIAFYSNHVHQPKVKQQVCDTIVVYDTVLVVPGDSMQGFN